MKASSFIAHAPELGRVRADKNESNLKSRIKELELKLLEADTQSQNTVKEKVSYQTKNVMHSRKVTEITDLNEEYIRVQRHLGLVSLHSSCWFFRPRILRNWYELSFLQISRWFNSFIMVLWMKLIAVKLNNIQPLVRIFILTSSCSK